MREETPHDRRNNIRPLVVKSTAIADVYGGKRPDGGAARRLRRDMKTVIQVMITPADMLWVIKISRYLS
jgi:hypothetical protein